MKLEKEKWINEVLKSADSIQQAEPNPFLFAKIRNRLLSKSSTVYVPARTVWITAAAFIMLVLLNWRFIYQASDKSTLQSTDLAAIVTEMGLFPVGNQLY